METALRPAQVVGIAILLALSLIVGGSARAVSIRVAQESSLGAGDFDLNVLGTVESYATAGTAEAYYGWTPGTDSYRGSDPEDLNRTSQLFLIDSAVEGLSLGILHGRRPGGAGAGGFLDMTVAVQGDPDGLDWLVQDDPTGNPGNFDDTYTGAAGDSMFTLTQRWVAGFTDGAVLGSLDGAWTVFVTFDTVPPNIDSWIAASSTGGDLDLDPQAAGRVRLQVVPEPATGVLMALGMSAVGLRRWVRRRQSAIATHADS